MECHFQVSPAMIDWVQGSSWATQGVLPKPLLHFFGCESKSSTQSVVLSALDQVFIKYISVLCSIQLFLNPDLSPSPYHRKTPPQHDAATNMVCRWDGIGLVRSGVWFPPNMAFRIEAKHFYLRFIRWARLSHLGAFLQTPSGLSCCFHWGEAFIWPLP